MPLVKSNSREAIASNISEMVHAGHPQKQAVAAALNNARHHPAGGLRGHYDGGGGIPSSGEMAPWYVHQEARGEEGYYHPSGLYNSSGAGRTDTINNHVPAGSYVVPADVVSGLGEGNTMAGASVLDRAMHSGPHGIQTNRMGHNGEGIPRPPAPAHWSEPDVQFHAGGVSTSKGNVVPIVTAGGEYLIHPSDIVKKWGSLKHGHAVLDKFVVLVRKKTANTLKKLPSPKGSKQ